MKAIFLLNNKGNVDYVYSKESQERIKNLIDIDLSDIYCQEELEASPEKFKDVVPVNTSDRHTMYQISGH